MGLQILRVHGDVGEQINRGLKYKELSICPNVVEAVPGITSLYVLAECLAYAVAASFVGVARHPLFVRTQKKRSCDI